MAVSIHLNLRINIYICINIYIGVYHVIRSLINSRHSRDPLVNALALLSSFWHPFTSALNSTLTITLIPTAPSRRRVELYYSTGVQALPSSLYCAKTKLHFRIATYTFIIYINMYTYIYKFNLSLMHFPSLVPTIIVIT